MCDDIVARDGRKKEIENTELWICWEMVLSWDLGCWYGGVYPGMLWREWNDKKLCGTDNV